MGLLNKLAGLLSKNDELTEEEVANALEKIPDAVRTGKVGAVEGVFKKPPVKFTEEHPPVGRVNNGGPSMEKK